MNHDRQRACDNLMSILRELRSEAERQVHLSLGHRRKHGETVKYESTSYHRELAQAVTAAYDAVLDYRDQAGQPGAGHVLVEDHDKATCYACAQNSLPL